MHILGYVWPMSEAPTSVIATDFVHVRQKALADDYRKRLEPQANRHELVDEICARLLAGEPLAQICRDEHMPPPPVLWDWGKQDESIERAIADARDHGADAIAMDALDISDNLSGEPKRDKLRVDTRLRLLALWNPKKYGESQQLKLADANGDKLDTAPLVGELLTMLAGGAPAAQSSMIDVTPRVITGESQPAVAAPTTGYRPRAKRAAAPPSVDDLV